MDLETRLALEGIGLVTLAALILAGFAAIGWRSWRMERARRLNRPVRTKVVESTARREDNCFRLPEDWKYAIVVTIRFETAGRGFTVTRQFPHEDEAAAFAAKYAMGTWHDVIPSLDRGFAFLPDTFDKPRPVPLKENPAWVIAIPIGFLAFVVAALVKVAMDAR